MSNIKIMACGGLGENGKNMYIVEVDNKIFVLDSGMKYPGIDLYGVDLVIPNIDYLLDNKDRIEGIFLSHGHEDNCGAIGYLLKNLPIRVYGSHFTISIVESMLEKYGLDISSYKLFRVNANKIMKFGKVSVTFFNTTHSIPESMGISLSTEDGSIVYCTDFNFGTQADGTYKTTFDKIAGLNKTKVLALMSESISSGLINRINNDSFLERNYNDILKKKYKRIIVGAFSTDLIRIQKIIDLSVQSSKLIAISSTQEHIIKVAMQSGYLKIPEKNFIDVSKMSLEEIQKLENVVIFITGYRFEPYRSMVRMSQAYINHDEDVFLQFLNTDKVILMCPPSSGTERYTAWAINQMYYYDTNLTIFDKDILRSAHASPEDLKILYSMVNPNYIIPIKGEYHHLYQQCNVAKSAGYKDDQIIKLDNGEQITFIDGVLQEEHNIIPIKDVYIDGSSIGVVDDIVIEERNRLAEEGIIFSYSIVNLRLRKITLPTTFKTRGFTSNFSDEQLTNTFSELIDKLINNYLNKKAWDKNYLEQIISEELGKQILRFTKHRPVIVPIIIETN